jgi:hypothetical protein
MRILVGPHPHIESSTTNAGPIGLGLPKKAKTRTYPCQFKSFLHTSEQLPANFLLELISAGEHILTLLVSK